MKKIMKLYLLIIFCTLSLFSQGSIRDTSRIKQYLYQFKNKIEKTIEAENPKLKQIILDSLLIMYKDGYHSKYLDSLAYEYLKDSSVKLNVVPYIYFSDSVRNIKSFENIELYLSDEYSIFKNGGHIYLSKDNKIIAYCSVVPLAKYKMEANKEGYKIIIWTFLINMNINLNIKDVPDSIISLYDFNNGAISSNQQLLNDYFVNDDYLDIYIPNLNIHAAIDNNKIYCYFTSREWQIKRGQYDKINLFEYLLPRKKPDKDFIELATYKYFKTIG